LVLGLGDDLFVDGVVTVLGLNDVMSWVRLVMKCRQSGNSSARGPIRRVRWTISRWPSGPSTCGFVSIS
jgi:hypothetical protein